jgi:hypothetical protein
MGTLMWFQDGKIREKNEGTFAAGELEGQATTTFADGSMIIGHYSHGVRHGEFVIRRTSGSNVRALYAQGKLISERELSDEELRAFRDGRYRPAPIEAASAAAAAQALAAAPAASAPQVQAAAPAPVAVSRPQATAAGVPWSPAANGAPQVIAAATPPSTTRSDVVAPWSPSAYGAAANNSTATVVAAAPVVAPVPAPAFATAPAAFPPPVVGQGAAMSSQRVAALGGPDRALSEAMMLERAGRNDEAAGLYADIAVVSGNTPTGLLANERAVKLRAPGDRMMPYQNAPLALQGTTALANPAQRQPLNGKFVCSAADLFANNANWCGRVLREEGNDVEVEIRSLKFNRLFAIGFSSAPCTGGRSLGPFAEGTKIWVSRGCLEGNP